MSDELNQILAGQKYQIETLEKIDDRLKELNGTVRSNQIRVTVLEQFCQEQVKPALGQLMNLRLDIPHRLCRHHRKNTPPNSYFRQWRSHIHRSLCLYHQ